VGAAGATGATGVAGTIGAFFDNTDRSTTSTTFVNLNVTGAAMTYAVPATANRVAVTYTFQCTAPGTLTNVFTRLTLNGAVGIGETDDTISCTDANPASVGMTRVWNVTPGTTVTLAVLGRIAGVLSAGHWDQSSISVIPGTQ
jgi:hypothetical protein